MEIFCYVTDFEKAKELIDQEIMKDKKLINYTGIYQA